MTRRHFNLNAAGDTIVEVLIAISIASLVLGGAFAVTSRTLKNARQAQEHSEALKLLEGQLEQLKAQAKIPGSPIFTGSTVFCINAAGVVTAISGGVLPAATYPAGCNFGNVPGQYQLGIIRGVNNVFTAKANWLGPTSSPEEVSLIYRLYP
jgi:type II secretory pathway pseudopilin PulG